MRGLVTSADARMGNNLIIFTSIVLHRYAHLFCYIDHGDGQVTALFQSPAITIAFIEFIRPSR